MREWVNSFLIRELSKISDKARKHETNLPKNMKYAKRLKAGSLNALSADDFSYSPRPLTLSL